MTNQELYDLMARFDGSGLHKLKLSQGDFKIELEKAAPVVTAVPAAAPVIPAAPAAAVEKAEEVPAVTAPLVGTFYAAPAPGEPPYVTPGTQVKKGDTLCLIEAMKMMSEVPAPADCVVEEVLARDGEAVGVGAPLFRVRRL